MEFEWDEVKRQSNSIKHGCDFADVARFDWANAVIRRDLRFDYGEERFLAFGDFEGHMRAVTFTRRGKTIRVLSFRRASRRERRNHGP